LRTAGVLFGCIALGLTAWAVKDTRPLAETSWWPSIFTGIGLLYGGLMPAWINLQETHLGAARFLVLAVLFHLLPFGAVLWYAIGVLPSTAYHHLVVWCIGAFTLAAVMTAAGALWRLLRKPPTP
jgi:hypothetical protein